MRRCRLEECRAACCLYGVWISSDEWERIYSNVEIIKQVMPIERQYPELWKEGEKEKDTFVSGGNVIHSRVVLAPNHYGGSHCIFLLNNHKCALQVASEAAGYHPWYLKPFYCILHPLEIDDEGRITLDATEPLLLEEGSCLQACEQSIPLIETFETELRYLLGDDAYEKLIIRSAVLRPVRGWLRG